MKTYSELRQAGYDALKGKWGLFVGVTLITGIISSVASMFPICLLIMPLFAWGFSILFLHNYRGKECAIQNLFDGFNDFVRIFVSYLWMGILVYLWTLLLVIPGIIKSYAYAMLPYILHDHPELSDVKAIHLSREMMYGHKGQLFLLHLSFIGWWLLCILTMGIGFLWLVPYMQSTQAAFYEDVRADYEARKQSQPASA